MPSFYVKYRSTNGKCLVGGFMEGQSSRFHDRADAETRMATILDFNPNAEAEIIESRKYPEIFRHCAKFPAQAIGGRCFGCGETLTVKHAKLTGSH
jgi:hypothetical protein